MQTIYRELKRLQEDVQTIKYAMIPEEKVSPATLRRYKKALAEMQRGKSKRLEDLLSA